MQSMNDDMDELFRKAAKDYPLETGSADWDKIAGQLNAPGQESLSRRYNKNFLWLLLLLPFSFICKEYFVDNDQSRTAVNKPVESPGSGIPFRNDQPDKNKVEVETTAGQKIHSPGKQLYPFSRSEQQAVDESVVKQNKDRQDRSAFLLADNSGQDKFYQEDFPDAISLPSGKRSYEPIPHNIKTYPLRIQPSRAQPRQAIVPTAKKEYAFSKERVKRFYAGIIGGMDATSIRFQKVDNASYDIGILLGYNIHKKWSVEAGLLLDKKFYYTKGEYFNTSKIRSFMPPNSEIVSVSGNCNMWEIPLSVRYDFKTTSNHSLFASAGVSSYVMNRERYNYLYYYPASGQTWDYYKSYPGGSTHLVSVAQFSAGYTFKWRKIGDVRIEPYVKLPLKGMGIGSIHLQSAGLHVGITRPVF